MKKLYGVYDKYPKEGKPFYTYNSTEFFVRNLLLTLPESDTKFRTKKLARETARMANKTSGMVTHIDVTKHIYIEYDIKKRKIKEDIIEFEGSKVFYEIDLLSSRKL